MAPFGLAPAFVPMRWGRTRSEVRPVKEAKFKSVEDLIVWLKVKRVEVVRRRSEGDSPSWTPPIAAPARFLIPERLASRELFCHCLVTKLTSKFSATTEPV